MAEKKKKLNKGLDAIFGGDITSLIDDIENNTPESSQEKIHLDEIRPNPYQPRKEFDKKALEELSESIKTHGIFTPLLVRKSVSGYDLITGERRLRAAKMAGLKTVPAIQVEFTEEQMMEIAILENVQREDLNPIEEAAAYESLIQKLGYTQEKLAERVGKSREYCANIMRLLKLPEDVQSMVVNKELTMSHVRPLLSLNDEEEIYEAAEKIKKNKMSVREVEAYVRDVNGGGQKKQQKKEKDPMIRDLEIQLSEKLGTQVVFSKKSFTISYHDTDDLNRILELIGCLDESIHQS